MFKISSNILSIVSILSILYDVLFGLCGNITLFNFNTCWIVVFKFSFGGFSFGVFGLADLVLVDSLLYYPISALLSNFTL